MPSNKYHAFISHNSKDKPQVQRIVSELVSYFSVWFDRADMLQGEDWVKQISQGLQDSDVCLIFVGKSGFGPSQEKEIQIAKDLKTRICCVFLPGAVPEQIYENLQISNTTMYSNYMEGENRTAFESLAAGILGKPVGWEFLRGVKLQKRAEEWVKSKSKNLLYKDDELREAQDWLRKHPDPDGISKEEMSLLKAFLKASLDRQNVRRMVWAIGTALILVVIGSLATFSATRQPAVNAANTQSAFQQATAQIANTQANEQRAVAKSEQLAALALTQLDKKLDLSLLLSVEAFQRVKTSQTSRALYQAWQHNPKLKQYIHLDHPVEVRYEISAWSSDKLAISDSEKNITVWDLQSGKPIQILQGHKDAITSVEWSSDGHLASGDKNGTIIVWDLQSSKPAQTLHNPTNTAAYIVWSNDSHLAINTLGSGIIIWDLQSSEPVQAIQENAISFMWSEDSRSVFILSRNAIIVWDFENNKPAKIINNIIPAETVNSHNGFNDNQIMNIEWSNDGRLAYVISNYTGYSEDTIFIWDSQNSASVQTLSNSFFSNYQTDYRFSNIKWSNDGYLASTIAEDVHEKVGIVIWNLKTNEFNDEPEKILPPQSDSPYYRINEIVWSNDGMLASTSSHISDASPGDIVTIWDVQSGTPLQTLQGHTDMISGIAWLGKGVLASISPFWSFDQTAIIWDLQGTQNKKILVSNDPTDMVKSIAWSSDGQLASGGGEYVPGSDNGMLYDKSVIIWDLLNNKSKTLKGHTGQVNSVAWSNNGQLASGSDDHTVIVWDLKTEKPSQILRHSDGLGVISVAWSDNGQLASIEDEGSFIIWDLQNGQPAKKSPSGTAKIAWSHDGRLSVGNEIWNLENSEPIQVLKDYIESVAWSSEGRLASSSGLNDNTVIIWDLQSGKPAQTLYGHTDVVTSVAWSSDGRLASGSQDGTIIIWDLPSGKPAQIFEGNTGSIASIAWSNDGKLASASSNVDASTITVWEANPDVWIKQSCQRAGRNLTQEEWDFYFPGETYKQTCADKPSLQILPTPTPDHGSETTSTQYWMGFDSWVRLITVLCCCGSVVGIILTIIIVVVRVAKKK